MGEEGQGEGVMRAECEEWGQKAAGIDRAELPAHEIAFVRASVRERRLKKQRSRIVMGVISAALVVAVIFMIRAIQAERQAEQNLEVAEQNYNQFLEAQAERVRNLVEDIIVRAQQLSEREGDYIGQQQSLLEQARLTLKDYSDNEKLAPMTATLDSMINNLERP